MRTKFQVFGLAASVMLLASGVAFADLYEVTGKKVIVRRGPSSQEPVVTTVEKGRILDGTLMGPWLRTEYADKSGHGYVYRTLVKPAKDGAVAEALQVNVPPVKELAVVADSDKAVEKAPVAVPVVAPKPVSHQEAISSLKADAVILNRTRLRKSPDGLTYRYLGKGEKVVVVGVDGKWSKVISQWKFESGMPMDGVVLTADLSGAPTSSPSPVVAPLPIAAQQPVPTLATKPVVQTVTQQKVPARVVQVVESQPSVEKIKNAEAARDALAAKLKESQAENDKLKSSLAKMGEDLNSVRSALANTDSRLKSADADRNRLFMENKAALAELETIKKQLLAFTDNGRGRYLAMADNGEPVFFKGVGEAQMAALENKTVIRFPLSLASKADKLLAGAKSARHLQGAFVYYIMDTNQLVF